MKRHGPNVWVVRHGKRFSVRFEKHRLRLVPPVSQQLATAIARLLARANRSELIVQSRSGAIRTRDSHGFDSRRRKG
jgi:hypothetical protein